jgi:hypothetical protein
MAQHARPLEETAQVYGLFYFFLLKYSDNVLFSGSSSAIIAMAENKCFLSRFKSVFLYKIKA